MSGTADRIRASGESLPAVLRSRGREAPDRPALGFRGDAGWDWATRGDLAAAAGSAAGLLREEGLEPGAGCAIVLPSDRPSALAILAAVRTGAVPVLVAPPILRGSRDLERVVRSVVEAIGATHVIGDLSVEGLLEGLDSTPRLVTGERIVEAARAREADEVPWHEAASGDLAFYQLTSGTTGVPKICVWTHRAVLAALSGMAEAMDLADEDVCFNWTPLYHDMGLVNNFLLCLAAGIPLAMMRPTDFVRRPERWLAGLAETRSTHTWSPNFGYALAASRIADEALDGIRLDGVTAFWNAAEKVHPATIRAFAERFAAIGVRWEAMKTNYGCAENIGGATFSDPHGPPVFETVDPEALHERRIARPAEEGIEIASAGRPAPGIDVRILDDDGTPLEDGRIGRLALHTPSRMEGYLDDEEATAEAIRAGWLVTGDLGYARDGEVFWVGRVHERIVINARKYDPSDFEAALFGIDGLRPGCFVAFGVDDPEAGTQRLVIVSEIRDPDRLDERELVSEVRQRVFSRCGVRPHDVILVEKGSLPKTSSGKRRHRHFKELYLETRERRTT